MNDNPSAADPQAALMAPGGVLGLRIGDWRVDPALDEISSGNQVVKLEPRNMRLLLYLASHAGRVVGLEELLREVWPNLVVTPQSVYNAIAQLRHSLGDSTDVPTYIATVARKGYRLIADVRPLETGAPTRDASLTTPDNAPSSSVASPWSPRSARGRRGVIAIGTIAIGLSLAIVLAERVGIGPRTSSPAPAPAPVGAIGHSIAVLPFLDMSEKKDQQYFADGLTEEMIDRLTKVRDLRVPARTSSFYFRGKQATIAEIAQALGVANVLEGSVRKSGNTLRVTAQLVRADNGYHLWSETYDRKLDDLFKVQDDIAGAVVKALKISLMDRSAAGSTSTQNTDAYNLYLQGRFIRHLANTKAEYGICLGYLRQAVQADSKFAAAWAELSVAVSYAGEAGFAPLDSTIVEARRAARQALELDPMLPDAHTAMARILILSDYNLTEGEQQIRQALALDPNSSFALALAAELAMTRGNFDQAIGLINTAIVSDPVNNIRYGDLGHALYFAGRYAEARGAIRKMLDLNPGAREDRWTAEYALLASGDAASALAELDGEPDEHLRRGCDCRVLALDALGRSGEANVAFAYLEQNLTINNAYPIGRVYANRGDLDRAFEWFDRAHKQRDDNLTYAKVDPLLKNVQSDPRFNILLRKIGLLD